MSVHNAARAVVLFLPCLFFIYILVLIIRCRHMGLINYADSNELWFERKRGWKWWGERLEFENAHLKANYVYLNEIYIKVIICIVFNNAFLKLNYLCSSIAFQHQLIMSTNISTKSIFQHKKMMKAFRSFFICFLMLTEIAIVKLTLNWYSEHQSSQH